MYQDYRPASRRDVGTGSRTSVRPVGFRRTAYLFRPPISSDGS